MSRWGIAWSVILVLIGWLAGWLNWAPEVDSQFMKIVVPITIILSIMDYRQNRPSSY